MQPKRKLLLINPINQYREGFNVSVSIKFPPLSLAIIAALTPENWDIEILDENFDEFKYKPADLVGITAYSSSVFRAYQINEVYQQKGIPVVFGGIHASMMPDEVLERANSVVIGEAEGIWKKVIEDFEAGKLQQRYNGPVVKDMGDIPIPRHDLIHEGYYYSAVQTTRGCPFTCNFCSVHRFLGTKHRMRPVENILAELETIKRKTVFFVDDNITGYSTASRKHAVDLFKGMIERKLNLRWFSQAALNFADDPEVLKYAGKSGCKVILIGVESEGDEQLKETRKTLNLRFGVSNHKKRFRKINRAGISVLGTFIFGLDNDNVESLKKRATYINRSGVDSVQTSILTPFPGTELYEDMKGTDRIRFKDYPKDWERYNFFDLSIYPKNMSPDELLLTMWVSWSRIYHKWELRRKFAITWFNTRNFTTAYWSYINNWQYRKIVFQHIPIDPDKRASRNYEKVYKQFEDVNILKEYYQG